MKRWTARLLTTAVLGGLGALYVNWMERTRVHLDHYTVEIDRPGLPPRGLTILHLSDFHLHSGGSVQGRKISRLRELLATEHYDVVALTGDLIHDIAGLPAALALVNSLRPRLATYFCPGNHDYAAYTPWGVLGHTWRSSTEHGFTVRSLGVAARALADFARKVIRNELVRMPIAFNDVKDIIKQLEAIGVIPLVNASTRLQADGLDVWFAGVDDELESHPDLQAALAGVPPEPALILLAHNPDIWQQCEVERADLVLSGHTHGGQIQLPGLGAIHTQGTHLKRSKSAGWFERGRSKMFVSRGVGESIPLRFRAGPQAALICLTAKPDRLAML